DEKGAVLYIGKAKRLRKRVSSYFTKTQSDPRIAVMLRKASRIDTVVVRSEVEALLLENELIKEHQPRYNITLKDAKTFAYIELTNHPYPRIRSTRTRTKHGELFGPYTDGAARRQLIRLTQKLFKLRTCRSLPKRSCLNYHIGLCTAPCIGAVTREEYAGQVERARRFLKGDTKRTLDELEQRMRESSERLDYEAALERKREIEAIEHLSEKQSVTTLNEHDQDVFAIAADDERASISVLRIKRGVITATENYRLRMRDEIFEDFLKAYYRTRPIPKEVLVSEPLSDAFEAFMTELRGNRCYVLTPQRGPKRALLSLAHKNARANLTEKRVLSELKDTLNLADAPLVIECFDVSTLAGTGIVAGMTRFIDAEPDTNGYRRFEIRSVEGQDDYAAIAEAVYRRYKRLKDQGSELPDLIVIDGGKGQLSAALEQLKLLNLTIPIVALAKREEELYAPGARTPLRLDPESEVMRFVRRVRDETHRFALSYQRVKRRMHEP
ncbi:MAG: excinuclease ABC subunit UvrC, partial [Candidatus Woesearchaeota archaeon]